MELVWRIYASIVFVGFCSLGMYWYWILWLGPERKREKLRRQGIKGPPPSIFYGNISDMKRIQSKEKAGIEHEGHVSHDYAPMIFPYFERWRRDYGPIFMYSLRNVPMLYVSDPEVVKEIGLCTSLDLGKPTYLQEEQWPLFGHGIFRSNGSDWAHQRKIIAPKFFMDKVKGMVDLMVESAIPMLRSWESTVESGGPARIGDVRVDDDLRSFSADVISKACFGSSYSKGKEIFLRLRALQHTMSKPGLFIGISVLRYLPTKKNRKIWKLDREVESLIMKVVMERKEALNEEDVAADETEKDLLQTLVESAESGRGSAKAANRFLVDNCKNIYFAGHETTAVAATWALMLLALNPDWQARARSEVLRLCGTHLPDAETIRKMKTLTMIIQETLRLYPPATFVSREALQEMKFGAFHIPEGTNLWISVPTLHRDPRIWGPDANEFNPERFAAGITGACKLPHVYMPFGVGPRTCLGQNFAMIELKVVLSLVLSTFSFSLSPKYIHSPTYRMVVEPEYGLNLLMRKTSD